MAEAAPDHSVLARTVDDLFQILVARGVPPLKAKDQILKFLRLGRLLIDSHIAAGARKTSPMRQATPEELKAEQAGKRLDFLYEAAPAGGITAAVDPQSWDRVYDLAIRGHHLIIEPRCGLDFPWPAYSFSIANPAAIEGLLRRIATASEDAERPPPGADKITQLLFAYRKLFESGALAGLHGKTELQTVCAKVGPNFKAGLTSLKEAKLRYRKSRSD